ncbi:hypothetical protein ACJJTC_017849 [Scirpophaga incertulas]
MAVEKVTQKLQLSSKDFVDIKHIAVTKERPGKIQVKLCSDDVQNKWLLKAKEVSMVVEDIIPGTKYPTSKMPIFLSETLTPFNRALLRNARKQLKSNPRADAKETPVTAPARLHINGRHDCSNILHKVPIKYPFQLSKRKCPVRKVLRRKF